MSAGCLCGNSFEGEGYRINLSNKRMTMSVTHSTLVLLRTNMVLLRFG